MTARYPAPWTLHGRGYIFIYKFGRNGGTRRFFAADGADNADHGGIGTLMLVDYESSTAGPYRELLFIPGRFSFKGKKYHSITKIYVSTMESVENGRNNWGIPKELADFRIEELGDDRQRITVESEGELIFSTVARRGGPSFPVSTRFLPLPLCQRWDGRYFFTRFRGRGKGRFSRIESMRVNPEHFPGIENDRPLVGIGVEDFTIEFPVANVIPA